ncbi:Hep/Hag repeat protein [Neisseria sicca ATCC 29256]|uniref:Hep/Hag repeat protein n=5 Tax=Neisseria TaxID=482 RepID=C6M3L3_NEISI|nr:YadA-like family protein [Neisseria sicca]EET45166.1 Hep/Hag repeat protein [Neisseria sicca ATCC 29256]QMT37887.1 YadA-like family protein [Neisseria sicca]
MNKIFKVVWNRTIGSFVVTSELAKGRVKSSSEGAEGDVRASEEGRLKTLFRLTALSAALLGFSEGAWAVIPEGSLTGGVLSIGTGSTSANGAGAMSIGHNAQAKINGALAIAPNSTHTTISNGNNAIAIGVNLRADGTKAIGIGADTTVNGIGAIAIGNNDSSRMANQGVNGNGAIGVGSNLTARGNNAIAVGTESQATANHAIAIGTGTRATGEDSIAIGRSEGIKWTRADNKQSVAIGWTAQATGATQAVAIGPDAVASGTQSTSIGNNTRATGDSSIAIGGDDWNIVRDKLVTTSGHNNRKVSDIYKSLTGKEMVFDTNPTFKGTTSNHAAVAVGVKAYADGVLSTAFGSGTTATGLGAAAFGAGATASQDKSVAIGAGSHTNTDATAVTNATINGISYSGFAGATHITSGSQVSFGSVDYERQLKHVAPGEITATSTDAINGSQLYAIAKDMQAAQTHYYSVNRLGTPVANYNNDGATGENAIAAGPEARAAASNAVVIGSKATVEAAAGSDSTINGDTTGEGSVAVGSLSKANGKNATAIGQKANAYGQNSFAGGQDTESSGKSSVAIGDGSRATDNSTTAVGPYTKAEQAGASAFGFSAYAKKTGSVAVGRQAQALNLNAVSVGNESKAKGEDTVAIGNGADAVQNRAMAIGKGAFANDADTIAFGAGTKADKRYAIAIGSGNNAWKTDSIALGRAANADGAASLALGLSSHTREANAIALGNNANADDTNSIAIGTNSKAAQAAAVAIGNNATALKFSAVVIGEDARSNNSRSVVIGYNASATNTEIPGSGQPDYNQTVAIGAYANAWGDQSTAIGNNVDAKGNSSIAIGADDWDTVAVKTVDGTGGKTVKQVYQDYTGDVMVTGSYTHTTSSEAAVAIGTKSQAIGQLSTAFGTGTIAEGVASAAFGMGAKATKGNSVAIGAGSTTTTNAIEVNEAKVNDLKYSGFAGGNHITSGDQVSFGSSGYERQLKNVAPGEISNTSTDAINGSQLYAVQNVLGNTAKTVKNVLGSNAQLAEDGSITMNNIGGTGENTVDRAIASLKTSAFKSFQLDTAVATGTNGRAENHSSQEITSGSTLRLEAGKNIHLHQSGTTVSINTVDNPEFTGVVTAKGGLNMSGNRITNLGQGTDTNDAVNVGQLQDAMNNLRVNTLTTVSNDAPFSYIDKDGKLLTRNVKEVGGQKVVSFTYVDGGAEYNGDVTIAALNAKDPQTSVPTIVGNVKSGIKDNDAVNVSQLKKIAEALGTQVGTDGSVSMPTYAVVSDSPATSSVVNYNTVGDALSALNRAVNSSLNFTGDVGNQFNRKLGSTVAVKGGQTDRNKLSDNNIGVVSDDQNHTLNVKLAKELTGLTSAAFSDGVTAGGTTVNGSGVTIGSGSNPVKLTAGGLSNGGHKITNIADGEADNDAASYKQVKAAKTEVQGGTNVASVTKIDNPTDGHTVYTINAKGAAVALDSSVDGLKLTSSENPTTNVTTYNLDLSDKTKESLKKADSALQNIGVQVNGAAAKTLNQADSILNFVDGTGTTAENKNGTVAFNVNKSTLTAGTGGVISADTAGDAFATATDVANAINKAVADSEKISIVAAGDNTHVASQVTGNQTLYTVHADKTTVSVKSDGKLALNPTESTNSNQTKTTNYELDLSDDAKAEIQKGVEAKTAVDSKGVAFAGNNGTTDAAKLGETVNLKGDDQNVVTEAGADGIKVKLKDEITVQTVNTDKLKAGNSVLTTDGLNTPQVTAGNSVLTTDGLTIANGDNPVFLTKSGLNNGGNKITKVAKGTEETDGVNVSQIKPLAEALNMTVGADGTIGQPSFTVKQADGTAGTPVHTVQDALNKVSDELNKGLTIAADKGNADKVNLGETVTYTSKDKNIVTTVGSNEIDFSLANTITVGKNAAGGNPVIIDGTKGTVSGLTNKTLGGTDFATKGQAATEEQIDAAQTNLADVLGTGSTNQNGTVTVTDIGGTGKTTVSDAIKSVKETAEKGWNLQANGDTAEKVAAGETVTFKDGKNIKVTRDGKNITVATSDDVEFAHVKANSVEAASVVADSVIAGNSVLTTEGLKIGDDRSPNQVSLTNTGLNNGGNKITKVAKGTEDADAVNVSQIRPLATALNTTVGTDGSIAAPNFTVKQTDGTAGTPVHTVQEALDKVGDELGKGLKIAADAGSTEKVNLGDTVTYTGIDGNIKTKTLSGGKVDFGLNDKVTLGKAGSTPIVLDGTNGTVSGLTNKTLGGTDFATKGQAATEEQLNASQVNLKTILGGNAENTNGNIAMSNIGGTNQNTVHDAIKSVKETVEKGWKLQANDDTEEKVAAGETVNFKDGKNIKVTRDGKNITVATSDDVEFTHVKADSVEAASVVAESVIAGNSVLTTEGLKIGADGSPNQVSLTTSGLNNGGNKIANVAKGVADTDAVNVSQLNPIAKALNSSINPTTGAIEAPVFTVTKADGTKHEAVGTVQDALDKVGEEVSKGLNIVADNGSSEKVNLGDTVTYTSKDKNIVTTSGTGKAIDFSLAEKVTIGKDAANGGKPVVIDGKEGIVSGLTNQALGGADFATKGQAATEEQLNETQANLAKLLGGNAANDKGNVATNDIGGTGKDNVHDAIAAVKETVGKGWNLKANDEADSDSENIAAGDTVTVKQGKNIRVKRSGKELTVETSDDVEFAHVKADSVEATSVVAESVIAGNSVLTTEGLKIGTDGSPSQVSLTNAGLNNGGNKIANVAKGTAATDAVNVAQLNEQLAATEKTTTVVAGKNVTVSEKVDGNNTEYTVNADKTTLSQAAGGAVKVSEGAKDADGVTDYALDLTDEAKADIAKGVAAKDAVDNKGLTFAADNGTTGAKKLGDSLSVKGDGNILTRADENGIGFSLADKITVGKAGNGNKPLVIDGTAGLISGLSNTTLGGADFATKGQAASEEQLNAAQANLANLLGGNAANNKGNVTTTDIGGTGKDNVHDAIAAVKETADKGWNLNANDETSSEKIGAGDTVTFKEGKNVKVSRNGKHITVATSDDVSFDKVTVGGSVLTDNGLTVGNGKAGKPVSLTKDGLNNGGNKVTDIAAGEADTDAVNVAQLKAAAAKATSKVDSGNDNIVVTPEQNADGSTTYKVATAPNLKADSFTAGDTVMNNNGVKVGDKVALGKDGLKAGDVNITADGINAGNKAISNVAAGVKDTDAANVGQLNRLTAAAKTEVEAGTNIASVTGKQGANGQTVYTVNADGASVSAGSDNIVVTKGNKDANNVTDYAVDLSKAVKADIAKGVAAKDAVDNKGISFAGDSGTTVANKLGDTVAVKGDANITTTAGANGIQVGLNKDLKVDSVKAGNTVVNNNGVNVGDKVALGKDGLKAGDVNITADGINAGGKKVTGVAAGTVAAGSTDAVNGGQLHQVYELIGSNGGNVNTAPPSVEADGKAGLGNIKNITLVDNSNNPNVTNVTNETKIAQSNGYSLVTYNVEDQGMYVTNNVIEAVGRMNEQGIKFFHTNDGEVNPDVQARNSEDSSASGAYATAVGFQAASKGTNAIAIGKGAKANAENTIAIGTGNIVSGKNSGAIGDPTVVSGNSSYSIGNNNNVSADNAYALGSNIKATVNDSVYLGDRAQTQGIHTADAAKGEAYTYGGLNDKAVAGKAGSAAAANKVAGVVTVGNGTDETRQVQGVAAGVVSADSTDAINGSQLYYTNQAIANVATQATAAKTEVTAGKNVVVNQTTGNSGQTVYNVATADKLDVTSVTAGGVTVNAQGVSIAAPTAHNPANTVSLSPIGLNNGGQRITNVAPAKEGTDAVNLNQLAGVGNALQNNIERVGKKAYAGVAGAIAQGSIPQVTRPGATGIGVGSGYYGGQSAMAIGVSAMSDGGNWVVKGNFSANTDGHVGVGAGALYQW